MGYVCQDPIPNAPNKEITQKLKKKCFCKCHNYYIGGGKIKSFDHGFINTDIGQGIK